LPGIVPLLSDEELASQLAKMKEDGIKQYLVYSVNKEQTAWIKKKRS
jgi:hypothetical protein